MLYDDKRISQAEGLYTVIGALLLAILLFVLLAAFKITDVGPSTDGVGHAPAPNATMDP